MDRDDAKTELLLDIRGELGDWKREFIPTRDLLMRLISNSGLRWGEWRRSAPLTEMGLARLLRDFGIEPLPPRMVDGTQKRGYLVKQFEEAFTRYLSAADDDGAPEMDVASEMQTAAKRKILQTKPATSSRRRDHPVSHGRRCFL